MVVECSKFRNPDLRRPSGATHASPSHQKEVLLKPSEGANFKFKGTRYTVPKIVSVLREKTHESRSMELFGQCD